MTAIDVTPAVQAAVTAALPHLAEQFALLLEGEAERDGDWIGDVSPDAVTRRCARLIREAVGSDGDVAAPSSPDRDEQVLVIVAEELGLALGPSMENDGNRDFVRDVIAAVRLADREVSS